MIKVLMVSPEMYPLAKTGGLADVLGYLPKNLCQLGLDVRVVVPFYLSATQANVNIRPFIKGLSAQLGDVFLTYDVYVTEPISGVVVYLIHREDLYFRPNLYRWEYGDYYDNYERFCFFSHAVMGLLMALDSSIQIIHCHDWQTALIPALLKSRYWGERLSNAKTVFTVHNVAYQGIYPGHKFYLTGLDHLRFWNPGALEYWGNVNLLKAGIVFSHKITTVSPTHAQELKDPAVARGLEGVFKERAADLMGILNGVDYDIWNPQKDPYIAREFGPTSLENKILCKKEVLDRFNIHPMDINVPLLGMVTRLDYQKGIDLLLWSLDSLMSRDLYLVLLGDGDIRYKEELQKASERHKGRFAVKFEMNEPLAHKIIAGCDAILIPSLYEPCGLTQMYALKYGTIPIARKVGGLADTIRHWSERDLSGTGFLFNDYDVNGLLWAVDECLKVYFNPALWKGLILNAMDMDFSWQRSAMAYLELYTSIL